ncbi:MAG: MBL fold metallo-hydrolase [Alphaproteobacteria bacterium]
MRPEILTFFDRDTGTLTHIVADPLRKECAIIDPVLDYEEAAGRVRTGNADHIAKAVTDRGWTVKYIMDTHIHADHLSGAGYLKDKLGGETVIGDKITDVLKHWTHVYDNADDTPVDGSQFDRLVGAGDSLKLGRFTFEVMHTPGHTPACLTYKIGDDIFVGDTLFAPHRGSARCDFPGGSAETLYDSIQSLYKLPDRTRVHLGHDYPDKGDAPASMATIGEQKANNRMINARTTKAEFAKARQMRDATLSPPRLILPSIQVNLRAGRFGKVAGNGKRYLKIPLDLSAIESMNKAADDRDKNPPKADRLARTL